MSAEGHTVPGLRALVCASPWGAVRQANLSGAPVIFPNEGPFSRLPTFDGKKKELNASATPFKPLGGTRCPLVAIPSFVAQLFHRSKQKMH